MKDNNLIPIIIPCCNQGKYIHDALQSVFRQTFKNLKCIFLVHKSVLKDPTENSHYVDL